MTVTYTSSSGKTTASMRTSLTDALR
ncbi:MAG: hypothetical protein RJA36_2698, partial [Pseudomonadota bacterium]